MQTSSLGVKRYYALNRVRDISGISGTGLVAYVLEMSDGTAVMVWDTQWATVDFRPSMEAVQALHGHEGATLIEEIASDSAEAQRARDLASERTTDVVLTITSLLTELATRTRVTAR
jgi:hypothetical protein